MSRRDPRVEHAWSLLEAKVPGVSKLITAKRMDQPQSDDYWPKRRELLRQQTLQLKRERAESAGQLVLPMFGDGAEKRAVQTEAASLTVSKGLHAAERKARA